ncbi:unnamed protein product [Rhizophagus irregularis]|nr:unnamed protein product [Rhizophagus irregularis]
MLYNYYVYYVYYRRRTVFKEKNIEKKEKKRNERKKKNKQIKCQSLNKMEDDVKTKKIEMKKLMSRVENIFRLTDSFMVKFMVKSSW